MSDLLIRDLVVDYGATTAVDDVTLEVAAGQFVTLLGPSGSGKTSILRSIAGYIRPRSGAVLIGGEEVTHLSPRWRDCGMVFQSYALFPHMSVFNNVAFGLRARSTPKAELRRRVAEALDLVQLGGFANRKPGELSGGQQQRVALARAVVIAPRLLLMDEPLGALDLQLREQMQSEIRRVQRELNVTTIYVTHDQNEAFAMSDRIVVVNQGHVVSDAPPLEAYLRPGSSFTASFLGPGSLMELPVDVARASEPVRLAGAASPFVLATPLASRTERVYLSLRPEVIRCTRQATECSTPGTVAEVRFVGTGLLVTVDVSGTRLTVLARDEPFERGQSVHVSWQLGDAHVIEEDEHGVPTTPAGQALLAVPASDNSLAGHHR